MQKNTINDITDFIFIGKELSELSHYDLLIINADWAEDSLAKDMKFMLEKNICLRSLTPVFVFQQIQSFWTNHKI